MPQVDDQDHPDDAAQELARVREAFERGDYQRVRVLTAAIADPRVRARADRYVARTRPDPLIRYILLVSLVLLVAVTVFAYSQP